MSAEDRRGGFVDRARWPEQLMAQVVSPERPHRVHGYSVQEDLAQHYSFAETLLLALTGEPPGAARGRAFELALQWLAPLPVQTAPTHAALLAQVSGAPPAGVLATAATALAEHHRHQLVCLAAVLRWLEAPEGPVPAEALAREEQERQEVERLRDSLGGFAGTVLQHDLSPDAALLAVLYECGLHEPWQIESALMVARLGLVAAEACAARSGDLRGYPINLPQFHYEPAEDDSDDR